MLTGFSRRRRLKIPKSPTALKPGKKNTTATLFPHYSIFCVRSIRQTCQPTKCPLICSGQSVPSTFFKGLITKPRYYPTRGSRGCLSTGLFIVRMNHANKATIIDVGCWEQPCSSCFHSTCCPIFFLRILLVLSSPGIPSLSVCSYPTDFFHQFSLSQRYL